MSRAIVSSGFDPEDYEKLSLERFLDDLSLFYGFPGNEFLALKIIDILKKRFEIKD